MKYIDLHTHSTASDGSLTPTELLELAAKSGVSTLALTDHDSVAGLEEASRAAESHGIEFVRGCEIASNTEYGQIDILGLWLPEEVQALEEKLSWLRRERSRRNLLMLEKLSELGCELSIHDFASTGLNSVGRPHMAMALVRKGYVRNPREAFERYLGRGRPAYLPKLTLSPEEAVSLLSGLGCVTALAHPMLTRAPRQWLEELVRKLIPQGLEALEAYHSEQGPAGTRHVVGLADKYGLLLCGGSDFHGAAKPGIMPGKGRGGLKVPEFVLERLKKRVNEKRPPTT